MSTTPNDNFLDELLRQLAEAEPPLKEAKKKVQQIDKHCLTELKSMAAPPQAVKDTLEVVARILCASATGKAPTWADVRKMLAQPRFLDSVVAFDSETLPPQVGNLIKKEYLSRTDLTYERVNAASRACGPLHKWVTAQVRHSEILSSVNTSMRSSRAVSPRLT